MASNGNLCVVVPLFPEILTDDMGLGSGQFRVSFTDTTPIAYIVDVGMKAYKPTLLNAKFVNENLEILGDL